MKSSARVDRKRGRYHSRYKFGLFGDAPPTWGSASKINMGVRVVNWISYEDALGRPVSFGGFGGHIHKGDRWVDYLRLISRDDPDGEKLIYAEALRQAILSSKIIIGADFHHGTGAHIHAKGVPQFSDLTVARFSAPGWGDLMAAIWSPHEGRELCSRDFQ